MKPSRIVLANDITVAILKTSVMFLEDNPEEAVPEIAKMLAKDVERNHIENLVDVLQEALCIIETGVDPPGV